MKTKRVLLAVPEALTFDTLSELQQEAIKKVFGEYKEHMTGTIAYKGMKVVDAIVTGGFNPSVMGDFDIDWQVLGLWEKDEEGNMKELMPLDTKAFMNFLPETQELGEKGEIIGTKPPVFHIPHNWAGWEPLEIGIVKK